MKVAVNTLVVIILGITMFGAGMYFLSTIVTSAQSSIDDISQSRKDELLQNFPSNQEVYIANQNIEPQDGTAQLAFGVYNRYQSSMNVTASVTCESCGIGPSPSVSTIDQSVNPGQRKILQALITNETWGDGQHVFTLSVENASDGGQVIGDKTFYVNG